MIRDVEAESSRAVQPEFGRLHLDVLHEIPADMIAIVTESLLRLTIGGEEEAGILDRIARQHEAAGADSMALPRVIADGQFANRGDALVRHDIHNIGVRVEGDVAG